MTPHLQLRPDVAVRPATLADAAALGAVQASAWREAYASLLPPPLIEGMDPELYARRWSQSLQAPPTPEHRVLVATAGEDVVGFAALAPPEDRDTEPGEMEVTVLVVSPDARRAGHGSRLLTAVADTCRDAGVRELITWVLTRDEAGRQFLAGAGWGADGATRVLDADVTMFAQVRMRTVLTT